MRTVIRACSCGLAVSLLVASSVAAEPVDVAPRSFAAEATAAGPASAAAAIDGDLSTVWSTDPTSDRPGIVIDTREDRRLVKVVIHWGASKPRDAVVCVLAACEETGKWYAPVGAEHTTTVQGLITRGRFFFIALDVGAGPSGRSYDIRDIELYSVTGSSMAAGVPPVTVDSAADLTAATDEDETTVAPLAAGRYTAVNFWFFGSLLDQIVLRWGDTAPARYRIELAISCESRTVWEYTGAATPGGVDVVATGVAEALCVRLFPEGDEGTVYDLREIEVYGREFLERAAAAATEATGTAAGSRSDYATDHDMFTEWRSAPSSGAVSLRIDLGRVMGVTSIRTHWGDSFPTGYVVFGSEDGVAYTPLFGTDRGDGGADDFVVGHEYREVPRIRYVLIVMPPSDTGFSIRQVDVRMSFFG